LPSFLPLYWRYVLLIVWIVHENDVVVVCFLDGFYFMECDGVHSSCGRRDYFIK
jgi:hypothetical protein